MLDVMPKIQLSLHDLLKIARHVGCLELSSVDALLVSDVDRVERFRLTLRFLDDVSTAS